MDIFGSTVRGAQGKNSHDEAGKVQSSPTSWGDAEN